MENLILNTFFPNQACLWGPYFLFRNSLLDRGGRVPPEPPGGSPAMIIQFPGPLLGCLKTETLKQVTKLQHRRYISGLKTKQKSQTIAELQHRCYMSGLWKTKNIVSI